MRTHGRIQQFLVADSGDDGLLLLAIDRVGRSARQEVSTVEYRKGDDDHIDAKNRRTFIDESLAAELSEWR
jgi:hypothetical protein